MVESETKFCRNIPVIDSIGNENIDYIIMDVADERNVLNGIESLKEKTASWQFFLILEIPLRGAGCLHQSILVPNL